MNLFRKNEDVKYGCCPKCFSRHNLYGDSKDSLHCECGWSGDENKLKFLTLIKLKKKLKKKFKQER